jgi:hypothetical protein
MSLQWCVASVFPETTPRISVVTSTRGDLNDYEYVRTRRALARRSSDRTRHIDLDMSWASSCADVPCFLCKVTRRATEAAQLIRAENWRDWKHVQMLGKDVPFVPPLHEPHLTRCGPRRTHNKFQYWAISNVFHCLT